MFNNAQILGINKIKGDIMVITFIKISPILFMHDTYIIRFYLNPATDSLKGYRLFLALNFPISCHCFPFAACHSILNGNRALIQCHRWANMYG